MDILVRNSFCFYVDRDYVPSYPGYHKHCLRLEIDDTDPSGCYRIERANFISGSGHDGIDVDVYLSHSGIKIVKYIGEIFSSESVHLDIASCLLVNWGDLCVAFPLLASHYSLDDLYSMLERGTLSGPTCDSIFKRDMIFAIVNKTASFEELVELLNTRNIIGLKKVATGFGASEMQHFSSGDTSKYTPSDPVAKKFNAFSQIVQYSNNSPYFADPSTAPYYRFFEIQFRFTLPPDIKKVIDGFVSSPIRTAHKMTYYYLPGFSFIRYMGYSIRVGNTYAPEKIVSYLFGTCKFYELHKELLIAENNATIQALISDMYAPYSMFMSPMRSGELLTSLANMGYYIGLNNH